MHLEFQSGKPKGRICFRYLRVSVRTLLKILLNKMQGDDIDVTVQGLVRCEKGNGSPGSLKDGVLLCSCGDELAREDITFNFFRAML